MESIYRECLGLTDLEDEETLGLLEWLLEERLSQEAARLRDPWEPREALLFKLLLGIGEVLRYLFLLELLLGDGDTLLE